MNYKVKKIFAESKLIGFFANFNKNFLKHFYNSHAYKYFIKSNIFFKNVFLKNVDKSLIVAMFKKIASNIEPKDIGIFILLVVLFNTLTMIVLEKQIDIFSGVARALFLGLGVFFTFFRKTKQ